MSTVVNSTSQPKAKTDSTQSSNQSSAIQLVEDRLNEVQTALWTSEFVRGVLVTLSVFVCAWAAWIVADHWLIQATPSIRGLSLGAIVVGIATIIARRILPLANRRVDPNYAAHAIEVDDPALRQSLTTYVTLREHAQDRTLRGSIVRGLANETAIALQRNDRLPAEATGLLRVWMVALSVLLALIVYWGASPKSSWQSTKRLFAPWMNLESPTRVDIFDVAPGDATVLAGRDVRFGASIQGLRDGENAVASVQLRSGQAFEVVLTPDVSAGSPHRHAGTLTLDPATSGMVDYSIVAGDAISERYRLTVKDVPIVQLESVTIRPPAYTNNGERVQSSGAISAVQDSQVSIVVRGNRALDRAVVEFNPRKSGGKFIASGGAVEMRPVDTTSNSDATTFSSTFALRLPGDRAGTVRLDSYRIKVWDADGQTNPSPIIFPIEIIEDLPPDVSIVLPQQTPKELPVSAQQTVEVHAIDPDFGLNRISLIVQRNRRPSSTPVLWSAERIGDRVADTENRVLDGSIGNQIGDFAVRPDRMGLRPGDLIRIIAVARDNRSSDSDPSVTPNERRSDPIELRIVAADDSNATDQDEDGVTSADLDDGFGELPESSQPDEAKPTEPSSSSAGEENAGATASQNQNGTGGGQPSSAQAGQDDQQQEPQPNGSASSGTGSEAASDATGESDSASQPGSPNESESGTSDSSNADPLKSDAAAGEAGDRESSAGGSGESGDVPSSADPSTGEANPSAREANPSAREADDATPPSHDGEAFERIEDYLEEKGEQRQSESGRNKSDPSGSDQSESGRSESGRSEPGRSEPGQNEQQPGNSQSGDGSSPSPSGKSRPSQGTAPEPNDAPPQPNDSSGQNRRPDDSSDNAETPADDASQDDPASNDATPSDGTGSRPDGKNPGARSDQSPSASDDVNAPTATGDDGGTDGPAQGDSKVEPSAKTESKGDANGDKTSSPSSSNEGAAQANDGRDQADDDTASPGGSNSAEGQPKARSSDSEDPTGRGTSGSADTESRPRDRVAGDGTNQPSQPDRPGTNPATQAPDPVDLEHAKKATDLVLDYLDQTRESPDQELLDRLNWTEQDLDRFRDRWQRLRELDRPDDPTETTKNEFKEALESLGLRDNRSESLRSKTGRGASGRLNDAGTRSRPPPAFREAFDSFRRNAGRSRRDTP